MAASAPDDDVVIIKKYANGRLSDTESSTYITLEHLAGMVRDKREFKVIDAKTGDDITHNVLTQIILEEENGAQPMLPVNFLRQLIAMYGGSMQSMVPQFLEESLEAFQRNQAQFRDAMAGAFASGPFAEMARRNMEMFTAAAGGKPSEPRKDTSRDEELARLRAELAALQAKVDKLAK